VLRTSDDDNWPSFIETFRPDLSHHPLQTNLKIVHSHIVDDDALEKVLEESVNILEPYHPPITFTTNVVDTPQPATPTMLDLFQIFPFHDTLFQDNAKKTYSDLISSDNN